MSRPARVLITFESIHQVLAAERALLEAGLAPDLVPVPREISANCGMAITVVPAERARALLAIAHLTPQRILDGWKP